jgi:hypothetical protein
LRISAYEKKSAFERGSRSIIDLIKGGLRKVTGSIGANPLNQYRLHAGLITIGVRGTEYVVQLCALNDCTKSAGRNDGDSRLHIAVLDGVISLEDEEGTRGELAIGQYAIADDEHVVLVEDRKPAAGLLEGETQEMFEKIEPEEDSGTAWPWIVVGALLGI